MSKLTKLVRDPSAFFMDALRNRWDPEIVATRAATEQLPHLREMIQVRLGNGDFKGVVDEVRRAATHHPKLADTLLPLSLEALLCSDRQQLLQETFSLTRLRPEVGVYHYYHGQAAFYLNDLSQAERSFQATLHLRPKFFDAFYFLAEVHKRTNRPELARQLLERVARRSKRDRTWLELAHLVETPSDLSRLLVAWAESPTRAKPSRNAREYLALAALRGENLALAKLLLRENVTVAQRRATTSMTPKKVNYSNARARQALLDLNRALEAAGIPFFLISGTLLGCIREGDLLGHDKDIDVGVWEDVPRNKLISAVEDSGAFRTLVSRSTSLVRIRHANGIAVDIFYHFRDEERQDYWHEGVKVKWHNSPFALVRREFLGETFMVPEDHDRYLEENYGDWRTPRIDFDSTFDTPNAEITNEQEVIIYVYKMLLESILKGNTSRVTFYRNKLSALGEPPL